MTRVGAYFSFCSVCLYGLSATAATLDTGNIAAPDQPPSTVMGKSSATDVFTASEPTIWRQAQVEQKTGAPQTRGAELTSEVIGEKPEEVETSRVFLRAQAITLTPGQLEVEIPFSYTRDDLLGFRRREIAFTPTLRAGLFDRLEGNIDLPLVWRENKTVPLPVLRAERQDDTVGIGDIGLGLKYALLPEVGPWPNIIGLVNVSIPSGSNPNPRDAIEASTGTGRWRTSFGVTAIRSFDPATVFGGISYEVNFDATLNDIEVSGGDRLTYNFGVGFAVNDQLTLSGIFLGEYREEIAFDGRKFPGTDIEPMSIRTSVTYRAANRQFIEPSVEWGLNEDALDTRLRISYIARF